ncbi:ABC-three component system protein [Lunatibacter salilacus]|uniref:ABC-three component system protein n=1 Tax=Lunatibacter salilacus TaxID=2483804 RepID=UPI00131E1EA0|nr:ABC-three component system protein [Lunatibacter salilacus]
MRKYPLHYINEDDFENLATLICRKILGEAVIPFAKGPDGGRDGRFHGKANFFPSLSDPWNGKIVIEAKHSSKESSSCSDKEFQKLLKDDILPKIERLKSVGKINYYLLITNRKLTGKQDEKIEDLIDANTGISNVIIADEKIQQWLQSFPDIVKEAKLQDLLRPLQFDESDLKSVIEAFHKYLPSSDTIAKNIVDFRYVEMEKKNELNKLSKDYFDNVMQRHYSHFESIRAFLKDPINKPLKDQFDDLVDELNAKITIYENEYLAFERLLDELYDYVISNNAEFFGSGRKRLVRVFINYMYCNCFIGKKLDA